MKTNKNRIYLYFAAANLLLIIFIIVAVVQEQVDELIVQGAQIAVAERRLAQFEENLAQTEANRAALEYLSQSRGGIIHAGGLGASLTMVQDLFGAHNLVLHELFTRELTTHEAAGHHILETRATISGSGTLDDILAFLHSLTTGCYYYRLERVQVTNSDVATLRLDFSIYSF